VVLSDDPSPTENHTLSLHDALPISQRLTEEREAHEAVERGDRRGRHRDHQHALPAEEDPPDAEGLAREGRVELVRDRPEERELRSEEHTSELQSRENLVCRLLLEKK